MLAPYLEEQLTICDKIGSPAFESKRFLPKEIFDEYHPGPKKTGEEIKAIR